MLLSFQVTNHKSIRDEQTLNLQPVYDKSRPALPVAAIFGANAAGKSNVLDAFRFMTSAVRNSFESWRDGVPRAPFRFDTQSVSTESVFVVELLLDGVRWTYGFRIDAHTVHEEWLYSYPRHRRRLVFERHGMSVNAGSASGIDRHLLKQLATAFLPPTALLLSLAGRGIFADIAPVYRWFASEVVLLSATDTVVDERLVIDQLERTENRARLVDLLVAADVGIADIEVERQVSQHWFDEERQRLQRYSELSRQLVDLEESGASNADIDTLRAQLDAIYAESRQAVPAESDKRLVFRHGPEKVEMFFADQSHGTKVWLGYLGPVLDTLDTGGLLVVDEIDTSLHPHLTARLIGLFRSTVTNPHGAQIVFTTHDATLLGKYFNDRVLARDEVWFTAKNAGHATELFSLADFRVREDDNVQRRYLTGSYGAIPMPNGHVFEDAIREQPA